MKILPCTIIIGLVASPCNALEVTSCIAAKGTSTDTVGTVRNIQFVEKHRTSLISTGRELVVHLCYVERNDITCDLIAVQKSRLNNAWLYRAVDTSYQLKIFDNNAFEEFSDGMVAKLNYSGTCFKHDRIRY